MPRINQSAERDDGYIENMVPLETQSKNCFEHTLKSNKLATLMRCVVFPGLKNLENKQKCLKIDDNMSYEFSFK